jgi:hypothetical protein
MLQLLFLDFCLLQEEDERRRKRDVASSTLLRGFERRQVLSLRPPRHQRRSALNETRVNYLLGA